MAVPKRLASAEARSELASILRRFVRLEEPADSIADRAVRLGIYREDAAVLLPRIDFELALEMEELLDELLIELAVAERLAADAGGWKPVEEVARKLGLSAELELE